MGVVAIILAGGRSERMNLPKPDAPRAAHIDKALLTIGGKSLIEHCTRRLVEQYSPSPDKIFISGNEDFLTGYPIIPDLEKGPPGPAGGIYAAWSYLKAQKPTPNGFITVSADCPFLPLDLIVKLQAEEGMRYCATRSRGKINAHRTCAYWPMKALGENWPRFMEPEQQKQDWSLRNLIAMCSGEPVFWEDHNAFFNVNTPQDLSEATQIHSKFLS